MGSLGRKGQAEGGSELLCIYVEAYAEQVVFKKWIWRSELVVFGDDGRYLESFEGTLVVADSI